MTSAARVLALVSIFLAAGTAASAQEQADPGKSARFQWGPLRFTPGIAITDVGVDSNVFNDPNHQLSDTTAAIGPAINLWTNLGPFNVTEKSSGQYLYFKEFHNQRAWNTANNLRIELPRSRMTPFAVGSYCTARQRP